MKDAGPWGGRHLFCGGLSMERKNMWEHYTEEQERELEELAVRYRKCLDQSKTERECVTLSIAMAEENGYQNIEDCIREGVTLKAGDKVYAQYMKKTLALFHIGTKPLTEGMNILGAHVDSPRLDVKQNPLYEDTQMAYLDTHYYGGVKTFFRNNLLILDNVDSNVVINETKDVKIHKIDRTFDFHDILCAHTVTFCIFDNCNTAVQLI